MLECFCWRKSVKTSVSEGGCIGVVVLEGAYYKVRVGRSMLE